MADQPSNRAPAPSNRSPVERVLTLLRRLPEWLADAPRHLQRLPQRLRSRKGMAVSGVAAALVTTLVLAGVPGGSPEAQTSRLALSGKELFQVILARHPGLDRASRVDESADRGSAANLIALPDNVWNNLSVDQRNSLGTWLNDLGGRWEIRVGTISKDGTRVLGSQAVINSQQWNQQMR